MSPVLPVTPAPAQSLVYACVRTRAEVHCRTELKGQAVMTIVERCLPPTRVSGWNGGDASLGQTCDASDSCLPGLAGPACTQVCYLTFLT